MRLLRSSTFRLALLYAGLFGGSVVVLLAFIYWSTAGAIARQADETIRAEIEGLAERYRSDGLVGLVSVIESRMARDPGRRSLYLLIAVDDRPIVGNLDRWPSVEPDPEGWLEFELSQPVGDRVEVHRSRGRAFALRGGFRLLVGRDVHELERTRARIAQALGWGLAMTAVLAVAGGVLMSRTTARRIEAIAATSREIMRGDLSRRIPTSGAEDDFDGLAGQLNEMLERIQTLMEDVRRVSDNVAHDLRTPLTRLRNRLDALARRSQPADPDVERALVEADGLLSTFNALLRIARVESGQQRAGFARVDLAAVAGDVVELYEPLAEGRGQTLAREGPAGEFPVRGDRDLLFQALANLLDNALKYSPDGGRVTLRLADGAGQVRVEVADSGPGIPPERRADVLKRFYRLEESRTTSGSGLGLSLVAAVARLHDGALDLGGDDAGLRAVLTLPRAA